MDLSSINPGLAQVNFADVYYDMDKEYLDWSDEGFLQD